MISKAPRVLITTEFKKSEARLSPHITYPIRVLHDSMTAFIADLNGKYIGVVMESIEAMGLAEKQESAVKRLLKDRMYDLMIGAQNSIHDEINDFENAMSDPAKNDPDGYDLDKIYQEDKK